MRQTVSETDIQRDRQSKRLTVKKIDSYTDSIKDRQPRRQTVKKIEIYTARQS